MKKFKLLGGMSVAFLAVVALASCGGGNTPAEKTYHVKFTNGNELVEEKDYKQDEVIVAPEDPKPYEQDHKTYTFDAWYDGDAKFEAGVTKATKDVEYVAKFNSEATQYHVYFKESEDDLEPDVQTLAFGDPIVVPEDLEDYDEDGYHYVFDGWYDGEDKLEEGDTCIGNQTFIAEFTPTPIQYKITFTFTGQLDEPVVKYFTCETDPDDFEEPEITPDAGYHVVWTPAYDLTKLEDQDVTGSFAPNTDTPYKVEHYQQKADFSDYTLKDTDNLTGTTNTDTVAVAKTYTGFSEAKPFAQSKISGDGSTVIKIYYDRDDYYEKDKCISFEDNVISPLLTISNANSTVDSSCHTDGLKSLKLSLTGTMTLNIDRNWVNDMFAFDNVDAIAIDARASESLGASNNDNLYYKKNGTWTHLLGIQNVGNEGLNQKWKTIYITKTMYENMVDTDCFFSVHNSSGKDVWIDNIRPVKCPDRASLVSAETASIFNNDSKFKVIDIFNTSYDAVSYVTAENSNNGLNVEVSNEYASEGNNSLHITTSVENKVSVFINSDMYNATGVGFLFDFYTPEGAAISNISNRYRAEGGNVHYEPQDWTTAGKWITFFAPKSAVYDNDFMLFRTDAAATYDFYIDNIRVANDELDFENGEITTFSGRYGYAYHFSNNYLATDNTMAAKLGTDFFSTATVMSISADRSTSGFKSVKMNTTVNDGLYISKRLYDLLGDDGLSIDMYTETAINFNVQQGSASLHDWNPGEWITLTVPKECMKELNGGYILFTFAAGNINLYMDNIRKA